MNFENLKPANISDIINRIDEYLEAMREMDKDDAVKFIPYLKSCIDGCFEGNELNELELKKTLVELVNTMYLTIANFKGRDVFTDFYFEIVVNHLFWSFQQKNIFAFFILDNTLRDDRFKIAVELFTASGFVTIYPYSVSNLEYSNNYTTLPAMQFKDIEVAIDESKRLNKHMFYLEKDDSVNYLKNVMAIADEFQLEYVCIFRNKAPDDDSTAIWLMGSFADYLDMDQS